MSIFSRYVDLIALPMEDSNSSMTFELTSGNVTEELTLSNRVCRLEIDAGGGDDDPRAKVCDEAEGNDR